MHPENPLLCTAYAHELMLVVLSAHFLMGLQGLTLQIFMFRTNFTLP